MRTIFNLLWFVLGGALMALGWLVAGIVMFVSIVGIPWGRSCFVIAQFALWPFGREAIDRKSFHGRGDLGTGALGLLGNVVWFLLAGWWLALGHLASAVGNFVTIIGIPFAIQHLKLAVVSLAPVGKMIVTREQAEAARVRDAFSGR